MKKKNPKLSIRFFLGPIGCKKNRDIRPLIVRIVYRRQKKEYGLGWKVHVSNFLQEKERVVFSKEGNLKRKEAGEINRAIDRELRELQQSFDWLKKGYPDFNLEMLVGNLQNQNSLSNVELYFATEIRRLQQEGRYGTAGQYQSGLSSFSQYLRSLGIQNLLFKEVNLVILTDYIHYLRKRNVSDNTVNMYIKNLRALYNKARKRGIDVGLYVPFQDVQIRRQETLKRALCVEDIRKIAHFDLSKNVLKEQARDLFMFSFYTRGMSFVDIIHLQRNAIVNDQIFYERHKTGQRLQVKIEKPLRAIIDKYHDPDSLYILPILANEIQDGRSLYTSYRYALGRVNRFLKCLGKELGIAFPLTTYVARHSWATIAKQEGVSIARISESLGHSSENTTQIYLRSFGNEEINQINRKVVNCILTDVSIEYNSI